MKKDGKLTQEQLRWVVTVLKQANTNLNFLDDKSQEFVRCIVTNYRNFGSKLRMSEKQLDYLEGIGERLFVFADSEGPKDSNDNEALRKRLEEFSLNKLRNVARDWATKEDYVNFIVYLDDEYGIADDIKGK